MAVLPRKPPVGLRPSNRSLRGRFFYGSASFPEAGERSASFPEPSPKRRPRKNSRPGWINRQRGSASPPRDWFALKRSPPDGPVLTWPAAGRRGKSFIRPKRYPVEGSCSARSASFWRLEAKRCPSFQTLEPAGPSTLAQGEALRWDEPPASTAVFRKLAPKRFRRVLVQTHEALPSGDPDDWAVARNKRSTSFSTQIPERSASPRGFFSAGSAPPAVWPQGSASFDLSRRRAALHANGRFCVFILSKSLLLLLPATARASCSAQDVLPTPPGAISALTVFGKKPGKYRWELAFPVRKPP